MQLLDDDSIERENIDSVFRFIHISDTHGDDISINAANNYFEKNNCDFAIITGDVLPNKTIMQAVANAPTDYLIIPGNHDADKRDGLGQFDFRILFLNRLNSSLIFPDSKVNYWYRDYEKCGKRLRVIGLDQFELDSFGNPPGVLALMTQKQIDWFVNILKDSYDIDGIIVLVHMGFGNASKGRRDTSNHNDFISSLASQYNNSYDFYGPDDPYMIPEIVDAFTKGGSLARVYNQDSEYEIKIDVEFTRQSNNFIGYFGGHLHWDEIEYLNDFPRQLQCLIAYCGSGIGSNWNDLLKTDYRFLFNVVDIDLSHDSLSIKRVGASQTKSGFRRKAISFSIFSK